MAANRIGTIIIFSLRVHGICLRWVHVLSYLGAFFLLLHVPLSWKSTRKWKNVCIWMSTPLWMVLLGNAPSHSVEGETIDCICQEWHFTFCRRSLFHFLALCDCHLIPLGWREREREREREKYLKGGVRRSRMYFVTVERIGSFVSSDNRTESMRHWRKKHFLVASDET